MTEKHRKTQRERIMEVLGNFGNFWIPVELFYDAAGPSARTRLSEMHREGLVESRFRARHYPDGSYKYAAKDWRLTSCQSTPAGVPSHSIIGTDSASGPDSSAIVHAHTEGDVLVVDRIITKKG